MYHFCIRPAYGSGELLIEFLGPTEGPGFWITLLSVLDTIDAHCDRTLQEWINEDTIGNFTSSAGPFQIHADEWGFVFIFITGNRPTLSALENALIQSGKFLRQNVDFRHYEQ